ncbi:hypothetical protein HHK36_022684 [Tetracentron sinense]|uniref:Uncharacterized protein n=1 Tax=Tetracentron sinense TaxID=13715 RepID=A0A835D929_TETSI|nr:hypothetical protein HHK36_022684 [Tetracentron sinense]
MKRAMPFGDRVDVSSSDESSSSDTDSEADDGPAGKKPSNNVTVGKPTKEKISAVKPGNQKKGVIDFEALNRHGYRGGLSVLNVPPPKDMDKKQDWSWSTGRESGVNKETEESYEERQRTRDALAEGEQLMNVQTRKEKAANLSFSQKEKRKRELGQASRGKNYVEEEKRLLRESGVYSGFDS